MCAPFCWILAPSESPSACMPGQQVFKSRVQQLPGLKGCAFASQQHGTIVDDVPLLTQAVAWLTHLLVTPPPVLPCRVRCRSTTSVTGTQWQQERTTRRGSRWDHWEGDSEGMAERGDQQGPPEVRLLGACELCMESKCRLVCHGSKRHVRHCLETALPGSCNAELSSGSASSSPFLFIRMRR
jgi:hypothetical protein